MSQQYILKLFILISIIKSTTAEFNSFSSAWETFWSVSCEFSDLFVSSTIRSKRSITNFDDPIELFNYLYPLADVKLEDFMENEQRSGSPHSISTWIQDLVDMWGSECHSRSGHSREKRDILQRNKDNSNWEDDIDDESHPGPQEIDDNVLKNATKITTTSEVPVAKKKKAVADTDTFFTQYGGDIEYFFPLISFGIPFDGEITFLGFHGFKGLFPYK